MLLKTYTVILLLALSISVNAFDIEKCHLSTTKKKNIKKDDIIKEALYQAYKNNINPSLVLSIIDLESGFNINAVGPKKEIGLMQLHPKYHHKAVFGWATNIKLGVSYLKKIKHSRCGYKYGKYYFICYNRGIRTDLSLKQVKNSRYVKLIMKRLKEY